MFKNLLSVFVLSVLFTLLTPVAFALVGDVNDLDGKVLIDGNVQLWWSTPDGEDLHSGFQIHYGKHSVSEPDVEYENFIDVGAVVNYELEGLESGEFYYFAVVAYDEDGNESLAWSPELELFVDGEAAEKQSYIDAIIEVSCTPIGEEGMSEFEYDFEVEKIFKRHGFTDINFITRADLNKKYGDDQEVIDAYEAGVAECSENFEQEVDNEKERFIDATIEVTCMLLESENMLDPSIEDQALEVFVKYGFEPDQDMISALSQKYENDDFVMEEISNGVEQCWDETVASNWVLENEFDDVDENHKNYESIKFLWDKNVIDGYPDGYFRPEVTVNRAEFTKMLINAMEVELYGYLIEAPNCFLDVNSKDWFAAYVCKARDLGWVNGRGDGLFHPGDTVNKAEATKMVLEAMGVGGNYKLPYYAFSDVSVDAWFAPYAYKSYEMNLHNFDQAKYYDFGSSLRLAYEPQKFLTRGEVSELFYLAINWKDISETFKSVLPIVEELKAETTDAFYADGYGSGDLQFVCEQENFDKIEEIRLMTESLSMNDLLGQKNGLDYFQFNVLMPHLEVFHLAVNSGCLDIVKNYYETDSTIDLDNFKGYAGKAPIHIAADNGDFEMVEFLLMEGADPNVLTGAYWIEDFMVGMSYVDRTALDFAEENGYVEIEDLILEYGGKNGKFGSWK